MALLTLPAVRIGWSPQLAAAVLCRAAGWRPMVGWTAVAKRQCRSWKQLFRFLAALLKIARGKGSFCMCAIHFILAESMYLPRCVEMWSVTIVSCFILVMFSPSKPNGVKYSVWCAVVKYSTANLTVKPVRILISSWHASLNLLHIYLGENNYRYELCE